MADLQIRIYDQDWQIRFVRRLPRLNGKKLDGLCDRHNREILIRDTLTPTSRTEVILHELDHAWHWCMDEDYVTEKPSRQAVF